MSSSYNPSDDNYDLDELDAKGKYLPSKTYSDVERHFITELEVLLGRVPCDAEVVGFCHSVVSWERGKRYILWKGELLFITDLTP